MGGAAAAYHSVSRNHRTFSFAATTTKTHNAAAAAEFRLTATLKEYDTNGRLSMTQLHTFSLSIGPTYRRRTMNACPNSRVAHAQSSDLRSLPSLTRLRKHLHHGQ